MFVDPAAIWLEAMNQYIKISPILSVLLRARAKREKRERGERERAKE